MVSLKPPNASPTKRVTSSRKVDECESLDGIALVGWDRSGVMETLVLLVVFEEVSLALGEALSERPRGARRHLQLIRPE